MGKNGATGCWLKGDGDSVGDGKVGIRRIRNAQVLIGDSLGDGFARLWKVQDVRWS